jgi:hypothetical protein
MGLDITAYSNINRLEPQPEEDYCEGTYLFQHPHFKCQADGIETVYIASGNLKLRLATDPTPTYTLGG